MRNIPLVDTHFHLHDMKHPSIRYGWLEPDAIHPLLGDVDAIKTQHYWVQDFLSETRFSNVTKAIHVQAAPGTADPVEETRWLQAFADKFGFPHAIVAECQLALPNARHVLEQHMEFANTRGVRDLIGGNLLDDDTWGQGFALLSKFGLVSCIDTTFDNFAKIKRLALRNPGTPIILDHCGYPLNNADGYFDQWRRALIDLAEAPNVQIKVSGIGMFVPNWTVDSIRQWVLTCIEVFTPARVVFGTNWPLDRLYSSYPDIVNAYREILEEFSEDESLAMFSTNAERLFRI